jgi:hypothetical protein
MMAAPTPATVTQTVNQITPEIHTIEPISGYITIMGISIYPMFVVLALALATFGYFLWRGQRDSGRNTFDAWDLIMDTLPDGKRRASGIKTTYQTAFIISSWVVIDKELKGTLDASIFGLYLATWCASLITKVVFDGKNAPTFNLPGSDK